MKYVCGIFVSTMRWSVIVVLSICLNVTLFSLFSLVGAMLKDNATLKSEHRRKRVIIAEYVKQEKKKEVQKQKRIRNVKIPSNDRKRQVTRSMKFSPELSARGVGVAVAAEQSMEAVIFKEGETDEDLIPKRILPIPYPTRARDLEVEGILEIELVIGTSGMVETIDIIRSPHSSFNTIARNTIMKWRFQPAKNKGVPVKVRARKEIEFKLN